VADAIRERARRRNLAIERVADEAGVSRSMMWAVLACQHSPNVTWLLRVSNALGCRVRDLLP
jgi:DNA-binding phage protein